MERIVVRWCETRNVGQLSRVGPDGPSKTQAMHDGYAPLAVWEADRVHAALCAIGRGAYFPMRLVELLDHVYWHGRSFEEFALFEPGRGIPSEILHLGIRSRVLVETSLRQFFKALQKAVEEQPRPDVAKEFER